MPRVADNWVFPNFGCSRYLAGFSTLRDICQHTQLVTPKSMRRMAVPAKAAMALRMLVPRLLLTCGRERGTKTKRRKDRSSSSPPSLLHPPFHGPRGWGHEPCATGFFSHSSFSSPSLGPQEKSLMSPFASSVLLGAAGEEA